MKGKVTLRGRKFKWGHRNRNCSHRSPWHLTSSFFLCSCWDSDVKRQEYKIRESRGSVNRCVRPMTEVNRRASITVLYMPLK